MVHCEVRWPWILCLQSGAGSMHTWMFCLGDFYWFQAFLGPGVGTVAASAWLSALRIGIFKSGPNWGPLKKSNIEFPPHTPIHTQKFMFLKFFFKKIDSLTPDSCSAEVKPGIQFVASLGQPSTATPPSLRRPLAGSLSHF